MKDILSVSESELEIMQVLWKSDMPLSIRSVQERLSGVDWKYNTVGTLLLRLEAKGAVSSKKNGRTIEYKPELDEEVYKSVRTRSLVEKLYNGSVKELAVSLFKSDTMTKEDIDEIKKMFDL
ncbi:MAG: BlaI/MecI/CopY family transcriptional regulator [Ruminococcaceae bacterium]|nr:BlaI/MecI/CopY family transcriptional regulator [Oscillospiraceae bacterium]